MIQVTDFRKTYGRTVAVDGIRFEVLAGQILGLIGPNGAGKTTTMRALAGIIPPTQGQLAVAGHDVVRAPLEAKRQLAFVPDEPALFEALTVWEHLQFTATAYRIADFEPQADALLKQFELEAKRDAIAQELSRGMRQKVAIVCAFLQNPRAMLFDEPLTGLDPAGIRTIKQSIRERAADGLAVIVSSHLLPLVEDLCTHLLLLHQGRVRFCGTVEQARQLLADSHGQAFLEDVFFQIMHDQEPT
jgi:ABC-2 type transport system ATP-binding protein